MYAQLILSNFGKKQIKLPAMKGKEFKAMLATIGELNGRGKK